MMAQAGTVHPRLGDIVAGGGDAIVTGFAIDHRHVAPGFVFGAFPGQRVNGEDFIADAVRAGAIAIVARAQAPVNVQADDRQVIHIEAQNPRQAFARYAAHFYAPFPDHIVAVTGTNGKSSIVEICRQLWTMAGRKAASMGTLGVRMAGETRPSTATTPDIVTFLSTLAGLYDQGVTHVAYEASSHGLAQYRTEGVPVCAAAFTNLTRDHLDYHETMAAYRDAKLRLFQDILDDKGTAIIWADCPQASHFIATAKARGITIWTVGRRGQFLRLDALSPLDNGQKMTLTTPDGPHEILLPLIGDYQAANALVAAALVMATGEDVAETLRHLERIEPIPGRMEYAAQTAAGARVYVDYAHTPDGLQAALQAARSHTKARILLVFGCGGERDVGKRAQMGRIAERYADITYLADDNPRGEDPHTIRRDILVGIPQAHNIGDRRTAIAQAVADAQDGDIVLIAGKGHENEQIIGNRHIAFDDRAVVREVVQ